MDADGHVSSNGGGAALDEYLSRAMPYGFSGSVLATRNGEALLHKGYGLADRSSGTPNGPETIFESGSFCKFFTAAAILRLEERGDLSVSDPLGRYFEGLPDDKAGITLHHLLTHTAGLPLYSGDDDYEFVTRDELVRRVLAADMLWPPGTRYKYSNPSFGMLAAIVEIVSGESYEPYLHSHFFRPAGMLKTGYVLPAWEQKDVARGYREGEDWGTPLDQPWMPDGPGWNLRGNGGMLMTVGDMVRWAEAFTSGELLSEGSREKMLQPHVEAVGTLPAGSYSGYGLYVKETPRGTRFLSRGGNNGYFMVHLRHYLDEGVVTAVAVNEDSLALEQLKENIAAIALGIGSPPTPPALPRNAVASDPNAHTGRFGLAGGGAFEVTATGNALFIEPHGRVAVSVLTVRNGEEAALTEGLEGESLRILRAAAQGDFEPLRVVMSPETAARFEPVVKQVLAQLEDPEGQSNSFEAVGTMPAWWNAPDAYAALVRIMPPDYEGDDAALRFTWRGEQLVSVGTGSTISPVRTLLLPVSETEFRGFHLGVQKSLQVNFQLNAGGRAEVLRIEAADGALEAARML